MGLLPFFANHSSSPVHNDHTSLDRILPPKMAVKQFVLAALACTAFAQDSTVITCSGPLDRKCCSDKIGKGCFIGIPDAELPVLELFGKCALPVVSLGSLRVRKGVICRPSATYLPYSVIANIQEHNY